MSVTAEAKVKTFEPELDLIFNTTIKEFTKLCIVSAPDYFFTDCPASTNGKYHPLDELGWDGTILHTKKVVTLAYELCRGLACEQSRDEILSASIIHDLCKQGWKKTGHTHKWHPKFGAELVDAVQDATGILNDISHRMIKNCVGYHYGPWSSAEWKKPLEDFTPEELTVYLADYVASKRCLTVDYRR